MTVNTLGSQEPVRSSRTVAEWLWPFLPMAIAAFFVSSLIYYHTHYASMVVRTPLQVLVAEVYRIFGLAPSFLFFLLVGTWSSIWLYTGQLDRPLGRLGRLAAMAVVLGVFLNLGDGGVVPGVQKGELGAWVASHLVGTFGYIFSLVLVLLVTIASMLLATDFFFSEGFDRLLRARSGALSEESGVETAVTDHLRTLGAARPAPPPVDTREPAEIMADISEPSVAGPAGTAVAPDPADLVIDDDASEGVVVDGVVEVAEGEDVEVEPVAPEPVVALPRRSYFERRQERIDRARATFAEAATEDWVPTPESQEIDNPESAAIPAALGEVSAVGKDGAEDEESVGGASAHRLLAHEDADDVDGVDEANDAAEDDEQLDDEQPVGRIAVPAALDDEEDAAFEDLLTSIGEDAPRPSPESFVVVDRAAEIAPVPPVPAPESVLPEVVLPEVVLPEVVLPEVVLTEAELAKGFDDPAEPAEEPEDLDEPMEEPVATRSDEAEEAVDEAPAEVVDEAFDAGADEQVVAIPRPSAPPPFVPPEPPVSRPQPVSNRQGRLFQGADEGLLQEAVDVVTRAGRASAGLLQRKLRVDYAEALGLLQALAARGVIALEGDATHGRVLH